MKNLSILLLSFVLLCTAVIFNACNKDEDDDVEPKGAYESGVFITNEGPFQTGTGTVSFFNRDSKTVTNEIFQAVNSRPLGNVVQSMEVYNNKGYIVVNNAEKVEVVTASDFKSVGVINGLKQPRCFLGINNNKGYISQWGTGGVEGSIKVVDLNSNSITKTINTGKGAGQMVKAGNFVYVVNSGGFANDSTVSVINTDSDSVTTTILVSNKPNSIQVDKNGKIWVLCSGKWNSDWTELETTGMLVIINASNNTVEETMSFSSIYSQPKNLTINSSKDMLFYTYLGKVFSHDITSYSLNSTPVVNRNFYGLGIDPVNNYIYGADAGDFASNGWVIRYNSSSGAVVDSFQVGIIPGGFCFR